MLASPRPTMENSIDPAGALMRSLGGVMSFTAPAVLELRGPVGDGSPEGAVR